ncbi:hypothetical protein FRC03_010398 [Tulasnella sp. 419]|nr:hypothetical protein FRC03_010398 [Tulasnella sp. 419]
MMNDMQCTTTSTGCRSTHEHATHDVTTTQYHSRANDEHEVAIFMVDLRAASIISGLKEMGGGSPPYRRDSLSPATLVDSDGPSDKEDIDGEPMEITPPPSPRSSPIRSLPSKRNPSSSRKLSLRASANSANTKKASPSFSSVSLIKGKLVRPEGFKTKKRKAWFDWEEAILDRAIQDWIHAAPGRSREGLQVYSAETVAAWDAIADACLTCGDERFCRGRQGILTKAAKAPYFRPSARSTTTSGQ